MPPSKQVIKTMTRFIEILAVKNQNEKKKKKRMWMKKFREEREEDGFKSILDTEGPSPFMKILGINDSIFDSLLEKITKKIQRENTLMRLALPAKLKLRIFLHFIATGCTMSALDRLYKVSSSSISKLIPEVADAICESLQEYMQMPTDENGWRSLAAEFDCQYGATNCVGVLQGRAMLNHHQWDRYDKETSVYLWYIVDAMNNLICMDVGVCKNGEQNFSQSNLAKSLETDPCLPNECYFVGRNEVELKPYLMTPFSVHQSLSSIEEIFNTKLEIMSQAADDMFNMMKTRFSILNKSITMSPDSVVKVIRGTCMLHNWFRRNNAVIVAESMNKEGADAPSLPGASSNLRTGLLEMPFYVQDNEDFEASSKRHALAQHFCK